MVIFAARNYSPVFTATYIDAVSGAAGLTDVSVTVPAQQVVVLNPVLPDILSLTAAPSTVVLNSDSDQVDVTLTLSTNGSQAIMPNHVYLR